MSYGTHLFEIGFVKDKDYTITTNNSEEWIEFGIFSFPKKDESTFVHDAIKLSETLNKINHSEDISILKEQMIGYKYLNSPYRENSFFMYGDISDPRKFNYSYDHSRISNDFDILSFYYKYSKDKTTVLNKLSELQQRIEVFHMVNTDSEWIESAVNDSVISALTNYPYIISTFSEKNIEDFKIKEFVIKHKDLFSYNDLPKCLANDKKVKEVFNTSSVYFSFESGFEPKTEEDYKTILNAYLKSDYTIDQFCDNYRIKDHDGFKNFLDKMARENEEYAEQIKEKGIESQEKFIIKILDLCEKIAKDELSIVDVMNSNSSNYVTLNKIIVTIEKTKTNEANNILHKMAVQLRDYIKDNPYTLKIIYLSRFFGKQNLSYEKIPKQTELSEEIKNFFTKYGYMLDKSEGMKGYYEAADIVRTYCQIYNPNKDILFTGMMVDGKMVEVTQNHIDQLVAFLDLNKLSKTRNVAAHFLKEIMKGNIDYSYKIVEHKEKQESSKNFDVVLSECTSAKEYFDLIDSRKKRY